MPIDYVVENLRVIPTTALEKRLEELENQLCNHLLWREILGHFTLREREAFEVFGERYGSQALEQKVWGIVRANFSKQHLTKLILQAKRESRFYAHRLIVHEQHPLPSISRATTPHEAKKIPLNQARDRNLRKKIAQTAKPLVQSFVTLEFFHQVLVQYFSESEQKEWVDKLAEHADPDALPACIEAIEARAGKSLSELMSCVTQEAERRVVAIIVDSVEEYRALERKGLAQPMMEALEQQNWAELVKQYQVLAS